MGNDEPRAYCCLQETVRKYLRKFFMRDNNFFLQAFLLVFRHLLAYHEPLLAAHMHRIEFNPELYAIPWFLTLFTHILHLEKIYRLWDTLLLQPDSLPLFLSVALMRQ